jgi:hypothetical protein
LPGGCDDADISDPDDRYINQPEKGPSFHTNEFMRGYNDGYDECSNGGDSDGSGSSNEPDRDFGRDNNGQSDGSGRINCDANPDDAFCNSEKGRNGLPFCDIVRNVRSCYDRNDNPKEYCEKYREDDRDFCRIIEGTDDVSGSTSRSGDSENDNDEDNSSMNNENKFRVILTFLEGEDRNFSDVRLYIQEYPQYGTNPPGGSHIDLNDAFYNDAPYTGVWEDEIAIPSGLIDVGEEFHICIEDTRKDIILACYELENGSESEPEHLEIDFNNFP